MPEVLPKTAPASSGDAEDVLRSLRRYVSLMLSSPPWTVRIQRTRVSDDQRPVAIIEESGPLMTAFSRATVSQGDQRKQQTYTIVCYPALGQTAADSRYVAGELRSLLDAGFSRGLVTSDSPPKLIGAPWRLPIWDFAGIPVSGAQRQGPADPYQHGNVDQLAIRPIQDAMDELRFTVTATLRVSWWQGGRVPPFTPLVRPGGLVPTRNVRA